MYEPPEGRVPARLTPALRLAYLARGGFLWIAVHLGMAFLGVLRFGAAELVCLFAVVAVGVAADQRIRREDVFLANAGIAPWTGSALAVGAAAVLEAGARIAVGLLR